jgi:hypothetical protein
MHVVTTVTWFSTAVLYKRKTFIKFTTGLMLLIFVWNLHF